MEQWPHTPATLKDSFKVWNRLRWFFQPTATRHQVTTESAAGGDGYLLHGSVLEMAGENKPASGELKAGAGGVEERLLLCWETEDSERAISLQKGLERAKFASQNCQPQCGSWANRVN